MTHQQTFDIVVAHLRKQNCKSVSMAGVCLYRGPAGRMCAAGCLIPDNKYYQGLEGIGVDKPPVTQIIKDEGYDVDLVYDLQRIHDTHPINNWERLFKGVALTYKLTYEEP